MDSDTMSSSAWILMDDGECSECFGAPPMFKIPPPPAPPDFPCELMDMACPALLNASSDTEFKKIGSIPTGLIITICLAIPIVIVVSLAVFFWRKRRKGVTQTKEFDQHNGPSMMNGNGILYEDLTHIQPRPRAPIGPPIEMYDVNHLNHQGNNGTPKLDFSYFLNPPPIYEELPDNQSEVNHNGQQSDEEYADEDELSVIGIPMNGGGGLMSNELALARQLQLGQQLQNGGSRNKLRNSSQSLTRKRNGGGNRGGGGGGGMNGTVGNFKSSSQKSLDRRNGRAGNNMKYPGTTPRPAPQYTRPSYFPDANQHMNNSQNTAYLTSNGLTMKIPQHLVQALCNGAGVGVARPYEVIQTQQSMANGPNNGGIYPSSRSSGSSYGEASSGGSARNNQGNSIESSDSGFTQSITSFINTPYDHQIMQPPNYADYMVTSDYRGNPSPYNLTTQQRRFKNVDRNHPLYSNHLLT